MGNQTQNPGQNPVQKAPGKDDTSRRDSNQNNPNDPNRQRAPGTGDDAGKQRTQQNK